MELKKYIHYAKKMVQLGPRKSFQVITNRIQHKYVYHYWKRKALEKKAAHSWQVIAYKHDVRNSFADFFSHLKTNWCFIFPTEMLKPLKNDEQLLPLADEFAKNIFSLLGSELRHFSTLPWHEDFRLSAQFPGADAHFNPKQFYKDIQINTGHKQEPSKDIKVPWELSRCYHFPVLGQAWSDTMDEKYVDAFINQATDWIDSNSYMLGVNWVCPMEVGIRALNWVVAFYFFNNAPSVSISFWQRFVCCLYDHFFYLENNWEIYDSRTSNHYLSDLIGYFYLCFFFQSLSGVEQKKEWCFQEIVGEFEKQVFNDGTDYEGSTAYHRLVTEIFYLFSSLCKQNELTLPVYFWPKLKKMFGFIDWCSPKYGSMFTIGDDDSGKILYHGITRSLIEQMKPKDATQIKHFAHFGLSIIRTERWHVTLRHLAYNNRQPSGHFHNDVGSITLALDGEPIFIDPGSFLYTPSSIWRNTFRSMSFHNSFSLYYQEPIFLDDRLFYLDLFASVMPEQPEGLCMQTCYGYQNENVIFERSVTLDQKSDQLFLTDCVKNGLGDTFLPVRWHFIIDPDITIKKEESCWLFSKRGKTFLKMSSDDLSFGLHKQIIACGYGKAVFTNGLSAFRSINPNKNIKIRLY